MRVASRAVLLALLPCAAGAQVTVSVPWDGVHTFTCTAGSEFFCGQSFTTPTTYTTLQSFSLHMQTASSLSFELYALNGSDVVGPALFTQTFGPTAGIATVTFAPSGGLALTAGAPYAALVRVAAGTQIVFLDDWAAPYAGGALALGCQPTCDFSVPGQDLDLAFTASFVPEPATLGLVAIGMLAIGGAARSRGRRHGAVLFE
ncbi:PEP motif putative anchor domain protein (plasmid) [Gemmatirosa kalamazoonensis]|uniref:PEP motif putative anchor domain protein n=1 Tax=Gemmatirosa kalamazoonensis TaxID=861299 RepID=W0RPB3_9BACT|nr:choice-of-anchor R domain-containing protein [Gemmatirosa kalamazoonensis]AHG92327.1 PEP motif putative anchor domain protein [Gemmatirosa kalamazoonensis]